MRNFLSLLVVLLSMSFANAGSRDSFILLVYPFDQKSEDIVAPVLKRYFNKKFDGNLYVCDSINELNFDLVYLRKRVDVLSVSDLVSAVNGDDKSVNYVKKIIGTYRDGEIKKGFDAVVLYELNNGRVDLFSISAAKGVGNNHATSNSVKDGDISSAMCSVLKSLPYAYGP